MSAFMVSRNHIRYMVEAAVSHRLASHDGGSIRWGQWPATTTLRVCDYEGMARAANILWNQNVASIEARYPDTKGHPENRPGTIADQTLPEFVARDFSRGLVEIEPAQVMRACRCYEYQSCEDEEWKTSDAKAFSDALYEKAAEKLCEEDAARRKVELKWGIDELPMSMPNAVSIFAL